MKTILTILTMAIIFGGCTNQPLYIKDKQGNKVGFTSDSGLFTGTNDTGAFSRIDVNGRLGEVISTTGLKDEYGNSINSIFDAINSNTYGQLQGIQVYLMP